MVGDSELIFCNEHWIDSGGELHQCMRVFIEGREHACMCCCEQLKENDDNQR